MTEPDGDSVHLLSDAELRGEVRKQHAEIDEMHRLVSMAEQRAARAEWTVAKLQSGRSLRVAARVREYRKHPGNPLRLVTDVLKIVRGGGGTPEPGLHDADAAQIATTVRQAMRAHDYDRALQLLQAAEGTVSRSPALLTLMRDVLNRRGDLSGALDVTRQLAETTRAPELRESERFIMGRLLETDERWLPRIPGPARPVVPVADNRVLHLLKESLPYHNNGFCMRSHYSLLAMKAAGIDPVVLTSPGFPRRDGITEFPVVESIDGIPHHRIDVGYAAPAKVPFDDYLRDYAWAASRLARELRPAIIHAGSGYRGYESALVGLALRQNLDLPLVYEVRSFFETTWTGDLEWAERGEHFRRRFDTENRCMRSADVVITIAEAMRDEIIQRGVDATRIHVIPNGVDAAVFSPRPRRRELQRRYGTEKVPTFGYVSNLDHMRENQELLVEAMAILKGRGRAARCLIIGDGKRRPMLEGLARERGVGAEVVFTGKVPHDQIQDYYALLDVFVVPRAPERAARLVTPLKPYEAMAMAIPCIVSDLPALVEITGSGHRGLSFPAGDAERLADMLVQLFDDPSGREELGRKARDWVTAERSWRANGERYLAAYRQALDGREAAIAWK